MKTYATKFRSLLALAGSLAALSTFTSAPAAADDPDELLRNIVGMFPKP